MKNIFLFIMSFFIFSVANAEEKETTLKEDLKGLYVDNKKHIGNITKKGLKKGKEYYLKNKEQIDSVKEKTISKASPSKIVLIN